MSLTLNKISYHKSLPIFSSEPTVCVKLSGMAIIDNNGKDGVMWDAFLPIKSPPEPESVVITTSRLVDAGKVVSDVDVFLNEHPEFIEVRKLLCDYFLQNVALIQLFRVLLESKDGGKDTTMLIPLPLFVDEHKKGIVYFMANNRDAGVKLFWRYDLMRDDFTLLRLEYGASEVIDSDHTLRIVGDFYSTPDIEQFPVDVIQASNLINHVDGLLIGGMGLNDSVSIAYKRSGTMAEARHIVSFERDEFTLVWDLSKDESSVKASWGGGCSHLEFKVNTITGSHEAKLKVDDLPFGFSSILQEYSLDKVLRQMQVLEPSKASDVLEGTLSLIAKGDGLEEYFSLVKMDFDDRHRTTLTSHSISHGIHYIRIFWDIESDTYDGFNEWVRASLKINHIKVEGVNYSYFPDSRHYGDICKKLPADFFDISREAVRRYMLEAHEYFWLDIA